MKKLVVVLSLFCMMVILAGCKYEIIYDFTQGNGVRVTSAVYYSEDEINTAKMTEEELKQFEVVTLDDGKTYYKNSETQIKSIDEISKDTSLGIIKANLIYIPLNTVEEKEKENSNATGDGIEDLENSIDYDFSFILTEDIVETNGTLSEDKRTVTFKKTAETKEEAFYAYTASSKAALDADKTAPVISGLKPNKYYKSLNDLVISDETGLKSITCNGIKMSCSVLTQEGQVKERLWFLYGSNKFKQGKNVIVATDVCGNTSTFTFLYDNEAPVFKKIKNYSIKKNKVVFYVKDTGSGIKKITYSKNYKKYKKLNKKYYKKVKKGKYKGYYKVTIPVKKNTIFSFKVNDKAGNVGCIFNVSCQKK